MKGQQAADGTWRMFNLLRLVELKNTPTVLLTLDVKKAFDRVHWEYLQATLSKIGFQGFALAAISTLSSTPSAKEFTSNVFSDEFSMSNGTRQGCPLSPLIFTLVMEPLAEAIRAFSEVTGITVAHDQHKIGLFADDVVLTLTNPESSLRAVQQIITDFSKVSFYKLNIAKSTILPINIQKSALAYLKSQFPYT